MRLYTFVHSPNPLKVRIALAELGVQVEEVQVNLFRGEHRQPEFRALNPHGKVPVLVDGDLVLPESNAILSYLGSTRGGGLWPKDAAGVARALRWLFFDAFSLGNQAGAIWWADRVSKLVGRPAADEAVLKDATEDLERALDVLEVALDGRDYLLGDFSLADCAVGVSTQVLAGTRLDEAERWPRVRGYRQRFVARPSFAMAKGAAIHEIG
jgi:glutathione S-transferase